MTDTSTATGTGLLAFQALAELIDSAAAQKAALEQLLSRVEAEAAKVDAAIDEDQDLLRAALKARNEIEGIVSTVGDAVRKANSVSTAASKQSGMWAQDRERASAALERDQKRISSELDAASRRVKGELTRDKDALLREIKAGVESYRADIAAINGTVDRVRQETGASVDEIVRVAREQRQQLETLIEEGKARLKKAGRAVAGGGGGGSMIHVLDNGSSLGPVSRIDFLDGTVTKNGDRVTVDHSGTYVAQGAQQVSVKDSTYAATGDGVADDTAEIQAALDAVEAAGGGIVFVPRGTYLVTGIDVPSGVALVGAGVGVTTIKLKAASDRSVIRNADATNTRIAIRDLTVDGNRTAQTSYLSTSGAGGFACGVELKGVTDSFIENVEAKANKDHGISVGGPDAASDAACNRVQVIGCRSHDNGDDGFDVHHPDTSDILFIRCVAYDQTTGRSDVARSGFEVNDGPQWIFFDHCYAYNCSDQGFDVHTHSGQPDEMHIFYVGCWVSDIPGAAGAGFGIRKANATAPVHTGIHYLGCRVRDAVYGWYVSYAKNVSIAECSTVDVEVPVAIVSTVDTVTVQKNTFIGAASGTFYTSNAKAVTIETGDGGTRKNIVITGNTIDGFGRVGVRVDGSADGVTIAHNVVKNNGTHASTPTTSRAGIAIVTGTKVRIHDNRCYDDQGTPTQEYGVAFYSAYDGGNARLFDNDLSGNKTAAFSLQSSSTRPTVAFNNQGYDENQHMGARVRSGLYYATPGNLSTANNLGNGTLRLTPLWIPRTVELTKIGAEVTTIGEAGSKFRLGIYRDIEDGFGGYPNALILDAGTINGDSATVQELTISQVLTPGLYWIGGAVQVAPTTQPTMRIINSPGQIPVGSPSAANIAPNAVTCYTMSSVTGALATFTGTVAAGVSAPRVFVKVA